LEVRPFYSGTPIRDWLDKLPNEVRDSEAGNRYEKLVHLDLPSSPVKKFISAGPCAAIQEF
jgi:hypothetical protein